MQAGWGSVGTVGGAVLYILMRVGLQVCVVRVNAMMNM